MSHWWSRYGSGERAGSLPGSTLVRIVLGVLLVGLLVEATHHLIVGSGATTIAAIDDWLPDGLLGVAALVCAYEGSRRPRGPGRWGWGCISVGLVLFATAEILWELLYPEGSAVSTPNPTDAFYLSTYPVFVTGLVLLARSRVPAGQWHRWLDGVVVALLVATPGVLLVLLPVLDRAPLNSLAKIVTVSYPLGDIVLLGTLLGALPLMSWRPDSSWRWLSLGLLLFTAADSIYTIDAVKTVSHQSTYDFVWTAGALALAVASTRPDEQRVPVRHDTGWPAIALPLGAQLFALAIQVHGYFNNIPPAERLLAVAILTIGLAQIVVSRPRNAPPGPGVSRRGGPANER